MSKSPFTALRYTIMEPMHYYRPARAHTDSLSTAQYWAENSEARVTDTFTGERILPTVKTETTQ